MGSGNNVDGDRALSSPPGSSRPGTAASSTSSYLGLPACRVEGSRCQAPVWEVPWQVRGSQGGCEHPNGFGSRPVAYGSYACMGGSADFGRSDSFTNNAWFRTGKQSHGPD